MFKLTTPEPSEPPRLDVKFPILGFLMESPMSGYDLKRRFKESIGFFYGASDGSLYPALKTLASRGLVKMRPQRNGGRSRKVYAITRSGREWFLKTLAEPSPRVFVHDESSVKLFFAHHHPEIAVKHLQWMKEHCVEMTGFLSRLEEELKKNETFPFHKLVVEMGKRITAFRAEMLAELAARVSRELNSRSRRLDREAFLRLASSRG
jgi:DNA-binding PadR family transcriptional regulator